MDGFRFDQLTRLVGARLSRRTGLALLAAGGIGQILSPGAAGEKKKPKKISICYKGKTRTVKKQGWRKRYKGASKKPNCGSGCCTDDSCFAESSTPNQPDFGAACCPAAQLCRSVTSLPDQCCYPGETCDPTLFQRFPEADTNCCRPCPTGGKDGCCVSSSEECINGQCQQSGTARLPRRRRL
jgi:hypothetical protein